MGDGTHRAIVIAVASPRQGMGKSVVALNLAASLALAEKRVLLVVADPRHTVATQNTVRASLYEVLRHELALGTAIVPVLLPQLEVVPSSPSLWQLEMELLYVRERELRLRRALAGVVDLYDFVVIDCPSSCGLLTISALAVADRVMVPLAAATSICVEAEQLLQVVADVRRNLHPALGGVDFLVNKVVQKSGATRRPVSQLLQVQIPASTDIAAAAALGLPAVLHKADGVGAVAFRQLAAALLARLVVPEQATAQERHL